MATSTTKTKIVQFSKQEYYDTLVSTGSVTVDGVTYEYSPDDTIYVTPSAIYFTNVEVSSNDWVNQSSDPDTGYEFYTYKAVLDCPGVTPSSVVQVIYADEQVRSGDYCNPCEPGADTVTIYSNNNSAITIPSIISGEPAIVGISQSNSIYDDIRLHPVQPLMPVSNAYWTPKGYIQILCTNPYSSDNLKFGGWRMLDGNIKEVGDVTIDYVGYLSNSGGFWYMQYPYPVKITKLTYINAGSTAQENYKRTLNFYTDDTKATQIGSTITANDMWQRYVVYDNAEGFVTNGIYFETTSGKIGGGELLIEGTPLLGVNE